MKKFLKKKRYKQYFNRIFYRRFKKRFFYPLYASYLVSKNHQHIIHLLSIQKDFKLKPTPPPGGGAGNNNNYFHFIFDYLLPVYQITKHLKKKKKINLIVRHDDKFNQYYDKLFPGKLNLRLSTNLDAESDYHPFLGMNPLFVKTNFNTLENFKQYVIAALNIPVHNPVPKIVLIERGLNKNGINIGANRRSLTNHSDLENVIKNHVSSSFEFINIKLEELTLKEQVTLFDSAALVIAQHGAGLSNCIWMKPNTEIVELSNVFLPRHYLNLAKFKKIKHTHFRIKKKHGKVNIKKFKKDVFAKESLTHFFNN